MEHRTGSGPYVYQPFGPVSHPERGTRLWGIGGLHPDCEIIGLTKAEAWKVLDALRPSVERETALARWVDGTISAGKLAELLGVSRDSVRAVEELRNDAD